MTARRPPAAELAYASGFLTIPHQALETASATERMQQPGDEYVGRSTSSTARSVIFATPREVAHATTRAAGGDGFPVRRSPST